MDWEAIDERLIRRGELLLSLDFLEGYDEELKEMNSGKVGRPYRLTNSHIEFLGVVRYLFPMPYRQLEGFTRGLHKLVPKLPPADYSWLRRRILGLDLSPYEALRGCDGPIAISIDSTGVKVHKSGGWVERTHGRKRRYIKIHFAVNVKTKEVVAMDVTTDDIHDSKAFPKLLDEAERHGEISEAYMDGSYDSSSVYELSEAKGIEAVIKPRRNSRLNTKSEARRKVITLYRNLGHDAWSRLREYGKRWSVETAFSTFKRLFGEYCLAKTIANIAKELALKALIYNMAVNM